MLIQGQVGPISVTSSIAAGVQAPIRQGNMGEQIVSELHGRYAEAAYRRNLFSVSNQTAVATTAALATTWTGLAVGNPAGSTVNLHMLGFGYAFVVAAAAPLAVGLSTGLLTTVMTASLTPRNQYVGGAAGQALATAGQTITAPAVERVFGIGETALAVASWQPCGMTYHDLGGSIILPPGTAVYTWTSIASGAAGFFGSFLWEEVPI